MAQRSRYGTFTGSKSIWDASNFSRGVKYTNEALREGEARAFVNLDISKSGSSLKPRHPYVNALFRLREGDNETGLPFSLPKDTVLFRPLQDMEHEYLIALSGKHKDQNRVVELRWDTVEERPYVIDGDTFQFNGIRYRLLGIDTPELGTDPNALVAAKLLDALFGRAVIDAENNYGVNVVYDSRSTQDIDVYGRHLVWLQAVEPINIQVYTYRTLTGGDPSDFPEAPVWETDPRGVVISGLDDPPIVIYDDKVFEILPNPFENWTLHTDGIYNEIVYGNGYAKLFGEYSGYGTQDNPVVFPKYSYVDMEEWSHGTTYVEFVDTTVGFPLVYKKTTTQKLKSYQEYNETVDGDYELTSTKIPYVPVEDVSNIIDLTGIWDDLDLQYNYPIGVRQLSVIREEDKEYFKMSQELKSKTGLSYYDGIMFIGEVFIGEEILYRGPMSFRYDVPLADDNVTVAWDKARIKISTYKKPYRVAYDELTDVSPNILDGEPLFTNSLFGEEAIEEGFSYPTLRSILISDSPSETTKLFSQLKYGKRYYIHPMVALPPLSDENGLSGYDGYAYKWIVTKIGSQVVTQEPTPSSELVYTTINDYSEELPSGSTTGVVGDSCSILGELRWTTNKVSRPAERHWATRTESQYTDSGSTRTILGADDMALIQNPDLGTYIKVLKNTTLVSSLEKLIRVGYDVTHEGFVHWEEFNDSNDLYKLGSFYELKRTFRSPLVLTVLDINSIPQHIVGQMMSYISANPKSYVILRQSVGSSYYNYYYIPKYNTIEYDYYERVFDTPPLAHQRIVCSDEPTTIEGTWTVGFDAQANPIDLSKWVLHNQMPEFSDSQQGILVTLMVAPVNYEVVGGEISITTSRSTMENTSFVLTSASYLYSKDEEIMPLKQDNENIYTAKYITSFDGRVVLYGTEKFPNIIYLSGTLGYKDIQEPLSYFPLRYAQDQFDSPVVHCLPYMDTLVVFTENDIWQLVNVPNVNEETGVSTDQYYAKKIVNNISLDFFDKETVRITNKHVVFMSNNTLYALRPNIYAEGQDLYLSVLSTNIHDLLSNPVDFLWERLRQRNIVFDVDRDDMYPTVSYFVSTSDNEISLFISMYLDDKELPYMVECKYDMEFGRWVIYDNIACSYPIQFGIHDAVDGPFYLMKNHPTIDYGVTYMKKVGINSWDFEEPYGKQFDIKAVKVSRPEGMEPTFIFNSALVRKYNTVTEELEEEKELIEGLVKVKQPINMLIDTGSINVGQHIFKRFHQMHLEISNVDAVSMGAAVAFNVDGSPRQTGTIVRVMIKDTGQGYAVPELTETVELNYTDYDELLLSTKLYTWQLDVSGFLALGRVLLKFPISGRGRVPHGKFILECANKIEIYRYGFVFKEQSMR